MAIVKSNGRTGYKCSDCDLPTYPSEMYCPKCIDKALDNAPTEDNKEIVVPGTVVGATIAPEPTDVQKAVQDKLQNGQSSTTILSSAPTIAKDAFPASKGSFIDPNIIENTKTANLSVGIPKELKNYNSTINSAMQSFNANSQNLKSDGLTFIASTTDKAIDGIDLPTGMNSFTDLKGLGVGQLGKLASMGGEAMSSAKEALKSVTGGLQDALSVGKNAISAVQSGLGELQSNIISPIKDLAISASVLTNPAMLGNLAANNFDFLPPQMAGMIGYQAGSAFNSATGGLNQKITDLTKNVYAIDALVGNLAGTSQGLDRYNPYDPYGSLGYGNNGYPTLSGMNGEYLPGYSSYNGSSSSFDQMAQAINQLCGNQTYPQYQDYNAKKSIYDILMMLAMAAGAGGLVSSLMNCTGGAGYNDARTSLMMYNSSQTVSRNGDPYTYRLMLDSAGPGYMNDPTTGMLGLLANSQYNSQNNSEMGLIMKQLGLTSSDLTNGASIGKYQTYDASKMTVLQQGDRRYFQQYAQPQEYSAVNVALNLFNDLFD